MYMYLYMQVRAAEALALAVQVLSWGLLWGFNPSAVCIHEAFRLVQGR